MRRTAIFALCALIVAGIYVNLRSIRAFPNWSATDEAIIHDYVDTWQRTGVVEASLVPYPAPTLTGNLYVYAAALWTNLFPDDPFALRGFSALGGIALLVVVFGVATQLEDRLAGLIAAALLATNLLWTAVAHVGRQEIWLAVFVWAAVGLSQAAQRRKSTTLALLAGLVVALSADVHPLGAYACLALGVWWLREMRQHTPCRLLTPFVVGGLLGTAYYFWMHVLPDPAYFGQAVHGELISYGAEGWSPLAAMLGRHLNYVLSNPLEVGLLVVCSILALRQRNNAGIGGFLGVLLLLYALTVADANLYYPILWITGMVILSALALRRAAPTRRVPLALAFFAAFLINAGRIEQHVGADWNARALDAIQQVAAQVPLTGRGMGESFLYLALPETDLIGFTFVHFRASDTGRSRWEVVESLQPNWIVTMENQAAFLPEFDTLSVDVPHMRLEIPDEALAADYRLRDTVVTSVGTFEIWERR